MINILKESKYGEKEEFVFSDNSQEIIEKLKNIDRPLSKSILTHEEAIVYAAKNYNIDISSSSSPSFLKSLNSLCVLKKLVTSSGVNAIKS